MAENTGATVSLGNDSGVVVNASGIQNVSYRGEENLWGNIWKWVDGINENNPTPFDAAGLYGTLYVADHGFTDNTGDAPYQNTDIHPCYGEGYVSAFGYQQIYDLDNLRLAHQNAKRGKGWYSEVQAVDADLETYLKRLQDMLINHTYKTSE